jgi:hypothetical protein
MTTGVLAVARRIWNTLVARIVGWNRDIGVVVLRSRHRELLKSFLYAYLDHRYVGGCLNRKSVFQDPDDLWKCLEEGYGSSMQVYLYPRELWEEAPGNA